MTVELSEKGLAFLEAWKLHDRAAMRISTKADVERLNGRAFFAGLMALEEETNLLVSTTAEYCEELEIHPVHFMSTLQALRRDNVNHEKALREVIGYLELGDDAP